jgi:UDP-N-acetylmuramate--alanine ligase
MRKRDFGIHFLGIGGVGMSGIARIAAELEYPVSGSDINSSPVVEELSQLGCTVFRGHNPSNIENPDLVVVSSAIRNDNPELLEARNRNIPIIPRAKMLGILMNSSRGIAVAGTHGKTTSTAMVASVLEHGGLDPTAVIGGYTHEFNGNAKLGTGDFFVAEADESDGSFLELNPEIAIINNIDNDHIDFYGSEARLHETFREFMLKVPVNGMVAMCIDDPVLRKINNLRTHNIFTYGLGKNADFSARTLREDKFSISFEVFFRGKLLGDIKLGKPGQFNVYNALAAVSVGIYVGLPFGVIRDALSQFQGVKRRFDILKRTPEMIVIDDYAHHPSEVKATLSSARSNHSSRIIGVFQPHRYSRIKHLADAFGDVFDAADEVIVTDIYSAGETPIPFVTSDLVLDALTRNHHRYVEYIPSLDEISNSIQSRTKPGDLVITLGAGDIYKVAYKLAEA